MKIRASRTYLLTEEMAGRAPTVMCVERDTYRVVIRHMLLRRDAGL